MRLFRVRSSLLLWALLLSCTALPGLAHAATEIRVTVTMSEESLTTATLKVFESEVERLSEGRLQVEVVHSAKLYKTTEVPQAVQSGAIEMGAAWLSQYVDSLPAAGIFSLPFLFADQRLAEAAVAHGSGIRDPIDENILLGRNVRVLFWIPFLSETFVANGPAVTSPDTIARRNVRVFGDALPEFIRMCGGAPVAVNGPDQYAAYKTGKITAGITSLDVFATNKLWEVANHVNIARPVHEEWVVIVNAGFWNGLSAGDRRILSEAGQAAEKSARAKVRQYEDDTAKLIASHGVEVSRMGKEDALAWKSCSSEIAEGYINKSGSLGIRMLKAYRALLNSTSDASGPNGTPTAREAKQFGPDYPEPGLLLPTASQ
jgi:C4-dicarboxylate-binding protein DctP